MEIVFHGRLADLVGRDLLIEAPPGCTIGQLRERLGSQHPALAQALLHGRVRACVHDAFVADDHVPGALDCIEFLPPVSGG